MLYLENNCFGSNKDNPKLDSLCHNDKTRITNKIYTVYPAVDKP